MLYPTDLKYSKSHEWVKMEDGVAVIGISDFAQDALGDVVFVNLPGEGDDVTCGEAFGDVESVKAVSDLVWPVTGAVCAVNEELLDQPELLNKEPYDAWIIKVENITDTEELLDAAAYEAFCAEEGCAWAAMCPPPRPSGSRCSGPWGWKTSWICTGMCRSRCSCGSP